MVATCQATSDARGGAYYRKKMAEGKSRKEALRCLKSASPTLSSGASWQIRRCLCGVSLDKEEPRLSLPGRWVNIP